MTVSKKIKKTKKKTTSKSKPPKKNGRPTKYKPEYCEQIIQYFDQPAVDEDDKAHDPIFLSAFARHIKVTHDTLLEWVSKYPIFSVAYKEAKRLQKEMMITNAMNGHYNASFTWRAMMNMHNWRDKIDNEHKIDLPPGLKVSFENK